MHYCNCKFRLLLPTLSEHIDKSSFVLVTLALRSAVAVAVAVAGAANQLIICMPHTMPNIVNIYYNIYRQRGSRGGGRHTHELPTSCNQMRINYISTTSVIREHSLPRSSLFSLAFPFATCPNQKQMRMRMMIRAWRIIRWIFIESCHLLHATWPRQSQAEGVQGGRLHSSFGLPQHSATFTLSGLTCHCAAPSLLRLRH